MITRKVNETKDDKQTWKQLSIFAAVVMKQLSVDVCWYVLSILCDFC